MWHLQYKGHQLKGKWKRSTARRTFGLSIISRLKKHTHICQKRSRDVWDYEQFPQSWETSGSQPHQRTIWTSEWSFTKHRRLEKSRRDAEAAIMGLERKGAKGENGKKKILKMKFFHLWQCTMQDTDEGHTASVSNLQHSFKTITGSLFQSMFSRHTSPACSPSLRTFPPWRSMFSLELFSSSPLTPK